MANKMIPNITGLTASGTIDNTYEFLTEKSGAKYKTTKDDFAGPTLENRYLIGQSGHFDSIEDAVAWLDTGSNMSGPAELLLDAASFTVADTIDIDLPYHLNIRGLDFESSILNATTGLTNKPMFRLTSSVFFERLIFNGYTLASYGTQQTENCFDLVGDQYMEIQSVSVVGFYDGVKIWSGDEVFVFNSIFNQITSSAININSDSATDIDIEVNTFTNCGNVVYLYASTAGNFYILNNIFQLSAGQCGIRYNPTNYILNNDPVVLGNSWNNVGDFSIGFDYSRSDGRDANCYVISNSGRENKNPHGKINVINNSSTTTITTPGTFYKAVYTNGSTYTCKFTLANNKITYQPRNKTDVLMWISCNVITAQANRNIDIVIVKNGNTTLGLFGQMTVRCATASEAYPVSTPVYVPDVVATDYFEIWVTNSGTGNVIVQDVSWMFDSK
jgi:hypothetical protein